MSGPLVAGIVVRSFQVRGAEVNDILVDDVCAVAAARLNSRTKRRYLVLSILHHLRAEDDHHLVQGCLTVFLLRLSGVY